MYFFFLLKLKPKKLYLVTFNLIPANDPSLICFMYLTFCHVTLLVNYCGLQFSNIPIGLPSLKLDGAGPLITHAQRTSSINVYKKRKRIRRRRKVICDMWHMTHDISHMTRDRWVDVNILSNFLYGLGLKMFWRFGGKGWVA